jgi:hypothetical protein
MVTGFRRTLRGWEWYCDAHRAAGRCYPPRLQRLRQLLGLRTAEQRCRRDLRLHLERLHPEFRCHG